MTGKSALGPIKGVIFDMDGTLTISLLDFDRIRSECGVPEGQGVLEYLDRAPRAEREKAEAVLARHERRAARECHMRDGAAEVLRELRRRGFRTALLTRNSAESVRTVLRRFGLEFECWVSRERAAPKPSAEPVLKIAGELGLEPDELLVVGDYIFDVEAGRAAGAHTAFVRTENGLEPPEEAEIVLTELHELLDALPPQPA
jgi:HAD superfamily hydrolase (TIGR01509 family)